MRRFTMTTPFVQLGIGMSVLMMRGQVDRFQCSDIIQFWRAVGNGGQVRGAEGCGDPGARDEARASRPSWRFKLRRAPAYSSSKPAMARRTQAVSTDLPSDSNSLASGALRKTGSFTFDVSSRRSVSKP